MEDPVREISPHGIDAVDNLHHGRPGVGIEWVIIARRLDILHAGIRFPSNRGRRALRIEDLGLVRTQTPLRTADQAARLVWLMDNWPRVALSLMPVVNRSSRRQSFVGSLRKASR